MFAEHVSSTGVPIELNQITIVVPQQFDTMQRRAVQRAAMLAGYDRAVLVNDIVSLVSGALDNNVLQAFVMVSHGCDAILLIHATPPSPARRSPCACPVICAVRCFLIMCAERSVGTSVELGERRLAAPFMQLCFGLLVRWPGLMLTVFESMNMASVL
jgi:hypothetical protein